MIILTSTSAKPSCLNKMVLYCYYYLWEFPNKTNTTHVFHSTSENRSQSENIYVRNNDVIWATESINPISAIAVASSTLIMIYSEIPKVSLLSYLHCLLVSVSFALPCLHMLLLTPCLFSLFRDVTLFGLELLLLQFLPLLVFAGGVCATHCPRRSISPIT